MSSMYIKRKINLPDILFNTIIQFFIYITISIQYPSLRKLFHPNCSLFNDMSESAAVAPQANLKRVLSGI